MSRATDWIERWKALFMALAGRIRKHLDERAQKQVLEWSASLEYRRRYTNPDDAKRHRKPPPPRDRVKLAQTSVEPHRPAGSEPPC
jgi:hypothetical protein